MASNYNRAGKNWHKVDLASPAEPLSSGENISANELSPAKSLKNEPLRIVLIYVACAVLWVTLTDPLVEFLPSKNQGYVHSLKGYLYIIVTGSLLFILIKRLQVQEQGLGTRVQHAVAASKEGLWSWDIAADRMEATSGGNIELGWSAAETINGADSWRKVVHPDDWVPLNILLEQLSAKDEYQLEQRFQTGWGGWHWFLIKGQVISRNTDGTARYVEGTYHSIHDFKTTQIKLEHANQALTVLVYTYQALSLGNSREDVFTKLVDRLARTGQYSLIWIGQATVAEQRIVPVVADGPSKHYLDEFEITWNADDENIGSVGAAIISGKPCLLEDIRDTPKWSRIHKKLAPYNIRSIIVIPFTLNDGARYVLNLYNPAPQPFAENEYDTYAMIGNILSLAVSSHDLTFRLTQSETERLQIATRLEKALHGTIAALTEVVEKRDPYTAGHQQRVAELATAIGSELGMSAEHLEGIYIGASIHDIGKIGVPTEILSKPGRLDDTEIALIRRHATIGDGIVRNIDFGWPVESIVHQHHERWDGTGYPQGLKGEEISLEARIVAVADVIESMGTNRPYRPSIPWPRVLEEIKSGRGTRYDPEVVNAALAVLKENAGRFGLG